MPTQLVGQFGFEVGRGGVEEQQIDLQIQQIGNREEHCFLHLGAGVGLHEEVHRPIRLILIHLFETCDRDIMRGPFGGGQLGGRVDRPVGDQREQHPLHIGREPAATDHLGERPIDAELVPQAIEQPGDPDRSRPDDGESVADLHRVAVVGFVEVTVDGGDQSA